MPGFDHPPDSSRNTLTNLPNRWALEATLGRAISGRPGTFALLEIDADGMKDVNDRYGHAEGDQYIRTIAEVLNANTRSDDLFIAHKSGDEFTVLLSGITTEEEVAAVRERIRETLSDYGIEVSIGGRLHQPYETEDELSAAADALMYEDKVRRKQEQYKSPEAREAIRHIAQVALQAGIAPRDIPTLIALSNRGDF